jgi:perosamine synthetase
MIPHSKPFIGAEEISAVESVMKSGMVAQGAQVSALEAELADFLGVQSAVAVSSGTAGLHLTLLALGANPESVVHIPSYVCVALLNAVKYCSAKPSICDVTGPLGNLSYEDLKRRIKSENDIVILPHMFGSPADVKGGKELGLRVVEDCAQSIGATIGSEMTGAIGDISVFSFYATKVICSGEGGAVASNSLELVEIVRDLRDYDHKLPYRLRFNYKMTDIQASMARVQLKKLPAFIDRRRTIAHRFDEALASTKFLPLSRPPGDIYFRYLINVDDVPGTLTRLKKLGICAERPVFQPIHRLLVLTGYHMTENLFNSLISIPCYPALSEEEVEIICKSILKIGSTCEK